MDFFCKIFLLAEAISNEIQIPVLQRTRALTDATNVVSFAFCETDLGKGSKKNVKKYGLLPNRRGQRGW